MSAPPPNPRPASGAWRALALLYILGSWPGQGSAQIPPPPTVPPPGAPSTLRLVVNIPAFRLDVYEGDALLTSYPVTVGKEFDPTPDGHYELRHIEWNPWWRPPDNRKPKDRDTPPGPRNPMGKVKLYFTEMYYLHGTFKSNEIGTPASRGCVRLRNPDAIALAELVHRHAAPLPAATLAALASNRSWVTHDYSLKARVPLELRYDLAEVRDGELQVYRDLYHYARQPLTDIAARALAAAGYSPDRVDDALLGQALQAATARGSARIPVQRLLQPATGEPVASATTSGGAG